jgi:hypothetical protein
LGAEGSWGAAVDPAVEDQRHLLRAAHVEVVTGIGYTALHNGFCGCDDPARSHWRCAQECPLSQSHTGHGA